MSEVTLGGYMALHGRAAAFGGRDGQPYSVGIVVADDPEPDGRYPATLLFVRWSQSGERPVGHVESGVLAWGRSPEEAEARIKALSLYDVKAALDEAILRDPGPWPE